MKRYCKIICLCMTIAIVLSLFGCSRKTNTIELFEPQNEGYINYNNYVNMDEFAGYMDYRDGVLMYETLSFYGVFDSKVNRITESGTQTVEGLTAPFQMTENGFVYKNDSNLIYRDLQGKETVIKEDVYRFVVYKSIVLYQLYYTWDYDNEESYRDELFVYDLTTDKTEIFFENPGEYVIYKDCLYITDDEMSDAALYKISLDTREKQFICNIEITEYPYSFQISNDTLIMPQLYTEESGEDHFGLLNLNTLQTTTLPIYGGLYDLYFICEGDTIYYSYEGIIRDGSLNFPDKDNEHNGTWKINMNTGEEERISDEIYTRLYLFDKTHLYGYSEKYGITEIVLD